jgi:Ca2+-binding EF-hand superfamily protein
MVFRVFDKNGDGSIDFSEFVLAYASQVNKDLDSQLDLIFSM